MEQRPLRVGDNVDDYCPRERRVTDHVVVALVGEAIGQTRCSACEAEHPFKGAKSPLIRKKPAGAPVLHVPAKAVPAGEVAETPAPVVHAAAEAPSPMAAAAPAVSQSDAPREEPLWGGHRPLIRAALPVIDGAAPAQQPRSVPEFTMHQRHGRSPQPFRSNGPSRPERFNNGQPHNNGNGNANPTGPTANGNSNDSAPAGDDGYDDIDNESENFGNTVQGSLSGQRTHGRGGGHHSHHHGHGHQHSAGHNHGGHSHGGHGHGHNHGPHQAGGPGHPGGRRRRRRRGRRKPGGGGPNGNPGNQG